MQPSSYYRMENTRHCFPRGEGTALFLLSANHTGHSGGSGINAGTQWPMLVLMVWAIETGANSSYGRGSSILPECTVRHIFGFESGDTAQSSSFQPSKNYPFFI